MPPFQFSGAEARQFIVFLKNRFAAGDTGQTGGVKGCMSFIINRKRIVVRDQNAAVLHKAAELFVRFRIHAQMIGRNQQFQSGSRILCEDLREQNRRDIAVEKERGVPRHEIHGRRTLQTLHIVLVQYRVHGLIRIQKRDFRPRLILFPAKEIRRMIDAAAGKE